jgi:hypothetical protein
LPSVHRVAKRVFDDQSHLNSGSYTLHQCRARYPYQVQRSCHCCQPLRSPRPFTCGTSITGMATASCPAIISRQTTALQFMVRRDQAGALQPMCHTIGITAGGTITATLGFIVDATTAAVSARAGLGRRSGRCGIAGSDAVGGRGTGCPPARGSLFCARDRDPKGRDPASRFRDLRGSVTPAKAGGIKPGPTQPDAPTFSIPTNSDPILGCRARLRWDGNHETPTPTRSVSERLRQA